jgi:signal transduction histidine kinase
LLGRMLTAQEEDRGRVAYEVHDGLTQLVIAEIPLREAGEEGEHGG